MDNWRLDHLKGLLKEDPKDEFILYALAQEHTKHEQLEEALSCYKELQSINSDYVGMYYHLAALYIELEQDREAKVTFEQGIEIAKRLGDQHALGELMNAKTNFELGV